MSYIFSSNGNNSTFKKLDNMLINMPETDEQHLLIWERVNGVPQYSWTVGTSCLVKVNNVTLFEHTHTFTQPFNNQWKLGLSSGLYLVNTSITCYNENDSLFNECDSIESVVGKGYKVSISMDGLSLLDEQFIHWKWYRWYVTLIEWKRIMQFYLLLTKLPNTSIILNWFVDGTEVCNWSHTSSIVNWSSNSPFRGMILSYISLNTNINRSNR